MTTRSIWLLFGPPVMALLVFVMVPVLRPLPVAPDSALRPAARYGRPALAIGAGDSTVSIVIRGVPVRTFRPIRLRKSTDALVPGSYTLIGADGTAPRVPIRPIVAPADSIEFQKQRPPAPVSMAPFHATLHYDRNLTIYLNPDRPGWLSSGRGVLFRFFERVSETRAAWTRGASGEQWIEMRLAPEDLRAVYRALEDGSPLVVAGETVKPRRSG